MRQVIEVVFEVHDDQLAKLAEVIKEGDEKRAALGREIRSLELFLQEQDVPEVLEIQAQLSEIDTERRRLDRRLNGPHHHYARTDRLRADAESRVRQAG